MIYDLWTWSLITTQQIGIARYLPAAKEIISFRFEVLVQVLIISAQEEIFPHISTINLVYKVNIS